MSSYLYSRTPSPVPGPENPPPNLRKTITAPLWLWNRCYNPVSNLYDNKDQWLRSIKESMTTSGNEKLLGHLDDLEIYINEVIELTQTMHNSATIIRPQLLSFDLEPELIGKLDKVPAVAYTWLRYIKTTWRPVVSSGDLASIFDTVNDFTEFMVELNGALARIYHE